jgi:DNA-binding MarR family transcriptional regulator
MDTPTIDALIREFNSVVAERDEIRRRLDTQFPEPPSNQKKLTNREVTEIRNLARVSHMTQREIADCYDVNPSTVSRILKGVYWNETV